MSGAVHLHQKVAGSLNLGFLSTYLAFFFLGGGVILILSVTSIFFKSPHPKTLKTSIFRFP